ncbi:MAG: hypothetical protein KJO54_00850 [Gammaproteobacteria bacterium]|nr:hypothetical protein [Gammaproteobacteria bacterium]NNF59740.1 hypothetical protein [Gammaproteobacteria bacterium]
MKQLVNVLFWFGVISIPLSWIAWWVAPEVGTQALQGITDPAMLAALEEAHKQRWGIYVGHWPVTLLVLSLILERRIS